MQMADPRVPESTSRHLQLPTGQLQVQLASGDFAFDDLLGFAARANNKRGFLFLSKVLGKHWPSNPTQMLGVQEYLAQQIADDLPGPILFIAMAETAIGLGQGVFEAWRRQHPEQTALFLHSSRYRLPACDVFEFAESHSHAPRQFLHLPPDASARQIFEQARSLVLIDDEASTGNTFVNLCAAYRQRNQALEQIHIGVIANFIAQEQRDQLALGLPYRLSAAICAQYQFTSAALSPQLNERIASQPAQRFDAELDSGARADFGRLGRSQCLAAPLQLADKLARQIGMQDTVLVLGTGEFMHPPFLLALAMQRLGMQVVLQSSTRSPILQWGDVACALSFADNYNEGILNYLYNVKPGQYRHILICHETPVQSSLLDLARQLQGAQGQVRLLHFLSEQEIEEISVC